MKRLPNYSVTIGEALSRLCALEDASVDAVITDPPYSSGGKFRGDRTRSTRSKYVSSDCRAERPEFAGDTRDQRAYALWCTLWLSECLRVARPGAPIVVFTDWRQLSTVSDVVQAAGWVSRGIAVWNKTLGARPAKGRFRQQCEFLVWGSNGPMPVRDGDECLAGCFTHAVAVNRKKHIAEKPLGLMREVVRICPPGGLILDPFVGSGTTGEAALLEGRRFCGYEIVPATAIGADDRLRRVAGD